LRPARPRLRHSEPTLARSETGPAGGPQDGGPAEQRLRLGGQSHRAVASRRVSHAPGPEVLAAPAQETGSRQAAALLPADGLGAHWPDVLLRTVDGQEGADARGLVTAVAVALTFFPFSPIFAARASYNRGVLGPCGRFLGCHTSIDFPMS